MSWRSGVLGIPRLVRFLALHALLGALAGCLMAGGPIVTDAAGIGSLFAGTDAPIASAALFFGSFALTFASLAMGSAIMGLPRDDRFPR